MEIDKNNIKDTWKTINGIIRKPTNHINFTNIKCFDTDIDLFSTKDISLCLNHYFFTIASKLANALPKISSAKPSNNLHNICSSIFSKPVYKEDIIKESNLLDNSNETILMILQLKLLNYVYSL